MRYLKQGLVSLLHFPYASAPFSPKYTRLELRNRASAWLMICSSCSSVSPPVQCSALLRLLLSQLMKTHLCRRKQRREIILSTVKRIYERSIKKWLELIIDISIRIRRIVKEQDDGDTALMQTLFRFSREGKGTFFAVASQHIRIPQRGWRAKTRQPRAETIMHHFLTCSILQY